MRSDLSANLAFLEQAADFSSNQRALDWQSPSATFRNSSLGQHLRHTLEHVEALLEGLSDHDINYDARKRDEQIEREPKVAAQHCHNIRKALQIAGETTPDDYMLSIRASSSCDDRVESQASTFGRELQFLVSHTVHHFAIMAGICHELGIHTPDNFGIAPSTQKHRKQLATK